MCAEGEAGAAGHEAGEPVSGTAGGRRSSSRSRILADIQCLLGWKPIKGRRGKKWLCSLQQLRGCGLSMGLYA